MDENTNDIPDDMTREEYREKLNYSATYGITENEPLARHAKAEPSRWERFWKGARKTWVAFIGVFAGGAAQIAIDVTVDGVVTWDEVVPPTITALGIAVGAAFAVWRIGNDE